MANLTTLTIGVAKANIVTSRSQNGGLTAMIHYESLQVSTHLLFVASLLKGSLCVVNCIEFAVSPAPIIRAISFYAVSFSASFY